MRRVLIIGGGGRENAIAWKLAESQKLEKLFCAPGNPGTALIAHNLELNIREFSSIKEAVLSNRIDLVVVGPEEPLVRGLRDYFAQDSELKEVDFIGPDSKGAKLEGSKAFAKGFMERHNIPTARYSSFTIETLKEGESFLEELSPPYVLKADGLAGGKGVVILESIEEAKRELFNILSGKFGEAGNSVVIEQFLSGIELSLFILTDGKEYLTLPTAKDYKRVGEGDSGLNTGGMGAISPPPFADALFLKKVEERVVLPTIEGLKSEGIEYCGFLFIGLMNCNGEPYVIEYNVRMGDPETEAVIPRLKSDLLQHLIAASRGEISNEEIEIDPRTALTVVTISKGYPEQFNRGESIELSPLLEEGILFHSGTKIEKGQLVTAGGRVFALTILANNIQEGRERLYQLVEGINYRGCSYRKDIGLDLLSKEI